MNIFKKAAIALVAGLGLCAPLAAAPAANAGSPAEASVYPNAAYAVNFYESYWCTGVHHVAVVGSAITNNIRSYRVNAYSDFAVNGELPWNRRSPNACVNINKTESWRWTIVNNFSNA